MLFIFIASAILLIFVLYKLYRIQASINHIQSSTQHQFNQFEAYHYLRDTLKLDKGIPFTHYWSASPDFLKIIAEHCISHKPSYILECSSGLSSLVLSQCCQINKTGHVISLEHEEEYQQQTLRHIKSYHLEAYCDILHAPLTSHVLEGIEYQWYDSQPIIISSNKRIQFDCLVIDGPPGYLQKNSRYPALPLLYDALAPLCYIFLDDASREDERNIINLWLEQYPGLQHHYISTERGCSVLKLEKPVI